MNNIFRKAITVLSSVAMVGATIGAAAAASYPDPFVGSTAVVYGANAAPSDFSAATNIVANLNSENAGSVSLTGGEGVTEDQIPLGGSIVSGKIPATITDAKVSGLLDTKINWDDGDGTGAQDYNIQEQIILTATGIQLNTTLDDNEYAEKVALTNDKAIEYRYVFDDAFNSTFVDADADTLYLDLLGKRYEVSAMTASSLTVTTSEEVSLAIGESYTYKGKTFTVDDVYSDKAQVNGELISTSSSKKIDGMRVYVSSVGYHSNSPELSKVILKIGEDISKTYSSGEEYVGEDPDDPEWVWTWSNPGVAAGYIGVKYNYKQTRDTDDVVYAGGSFIFPENYAEVKFEGLTDVDYKDYKVYFDLTEDLWNSTDLTSTATVQDAPVLIIEALSGEKDAIKISGNADVGGGTTVNIETNKIYLRWAVNQSATESTEDEVGVGVDNFGGLELFYSDVNGDVSSSIKPRFGARYNSTAVAGTISEVDLGDLIVGDTEVQILATVADSDLNLTFIDDGAANSIQVDVGGVNLTHATGSMKWLGGNTETTSKEIGESTDINVTAGGVLTSIGTYDNDVMTYNGLIIKTPEANADDDQVIISVPSDRVYGIVSVLAGGSAVDGETGALVVKDSETSKITGKNLIVVGGSAINAVAADLLGSAYAGEAFAAQTGVDAGKFLIQSFNRNGKTALLVAGYNAADTEKASQYLLNNAVDTTVGKKYVGTSATEATLVVQ
ncbi:MAG: hypothetical protein WC548_02985 [Candidatus Pacearchaeota archaeon]